MVDLACSSLVIERCCSYSGAVARRGWSASVLLTASFVLATGVCVLQTSANPYVSILEPEAQLRLV